MRSPTLAELAQALSRGQLSSRKLVQDCLDRIADPAGEGPRTFLLVDRDGALAQADAIDALRAAGKAPSPYAGIPISIKDLFDVTGQVTTAGSVALATEPAAAADAPAVARLRSAGFVLIGRTNMTEFAFSGLGLNPHFGTPLNSWNRQQGHIPGGSSSGAAVSITDGMAHAALATDTGGSCRIPAAFTGLVGYKPTARRIPRDGMVPLSSSLDSVGSIGRSVACCALIDSVLASSSLPDFAAAAIDMPAPPPSSLSLAAPRTLVLDNIEPQVASDFQAALSLLSAAGARISEIDLPEFGEMPVINAKGGLSNAESYLWHRPLIERAAAKYDQRVLNRIQVGARQSTDDYRVLLEARARFIAGATRRVASYDALLMPTVPVTPPRLSALQRDDVYYPTNLLTLRNPSLINFLDGCAVSLPMHRPGQAPTGLTLAALGGTDRALLRCAAAVERLLAQRDAPH